MSYEDYTNRDDSGWKNAGTPEWNSTPAGGNGSGKKKKSGGLGKKILVTLLCAVIFGAAAGGAFLGVSSAGMRLIRPAASADSAVASEDDTEALPSGSEDPEDTEAAGNADGAGSTEGSDSQTASSATAHTADTAASTSALADLNTTGGTYSSLQELVADVMPSVVAVTSTTEYEYYYRSFFGGYTGDSETRTAIGAGSGVIYQETEDEILIITNYHVISSADSLTVTFLDDAENEDANVTAYVKGMNRDLDLAVIAVEKSDIADYILEQLAVATIGDSSSVSVGESVIAIGNALAYGQSVTSGIVSATDRALTTDITDMEGLIQTDAAINNGNSGGGLFNMNGELIGINVAKTSSGGYTTAIVENMGYAIPVSEELKAIEEMAGQETRITVDESERCFLGIQNYQTVTEEISQNYDMPVGVYVSRVVAGSPAEAAGMRDGDIITSFDGNEITSADDLTSLLRYYAGDTQVQVTVQRSSSNGYHEVVLNVTLGFARDNAS